MTECSKKACKDKAKNERIQLAFPFFKSLKLTVDFEGGVITSDGGLVFLREQDERAGFCEVPAYIILDIDSTDDPCRGDQLVGFFDGRRERSRDRGVNSGLEAGQRQVRGLLRLGENLRGLDSGRSNRLVRARERLIRDNLGLGMLPVSLEQSVLVPALAEEDEPYLRFFFRATYQSFPESHVITPGTLESCLPHMAGAPLGTSCGLTPFPGGRSRKCPRSH